jgi:conjugal transfer mating pair stabilization protein TraN
MCVKTVSTACIGPTYTCPTGYNQGAGNTCTAVPSCTVGTLDNATMQCVTGYTCPLGSQFNCFPNTDKNNVMQCNNISCIDGSTQNPTTNTSDNSTYHDDGQKDANGKCLGTIMIFNGKPLECRPSGVNTNFFNCCDQSDGSFLIIKKVCGEPDTECVAKASTGSCHFIGDYCKQEWWRIGCVQRANVFCCFNSMLARIIHEQGRPQLQSFNGWGSVGAPDCRGFTEEEFSHIDFSKIDFSEYINATKTKMDNKMQTIQNKLTQQNKSKIEEKIQ